jgi:hypothetical protein
MRFVMDEMKVGSPYNIGDKVPSDALVGGNSDKFWVVVSGMHMTTSGAYDHGAGIAGDFVRQDITPAGFVTGEPEAVAGNLSPQFTEVWPFHTL